MNNYTINFNDPLPFNEKEISKLNGICGLYFIFLENNQIHYPFGNSRLIYIGMSEKKSNSIANRLMNHYNGQSGNIGIFNYRNVEKVLFTYLNFVILEEIWKYSIEDLESYFILDFLDKYGVYPVCNNKTNFDIQTKKLNFTLNINWKYFEK